MKLLKSCYQRKLVVRDNEFQPIFSNFINVLYVTFIQLVKVLESVLKKLARYDEGSFTASLLSLSVSIHLEIIVATKFLGNVHSIAA